MNKQQTTIQKELKVKIIASEIMKDFLEIEIKKLKKQLFNIELDLNKN